jgi:hypothetical protein
LFLISRTDIIKLVTVNTYWSIESLLFDHGINQIYAGAVTSRSILKHNESIRPPTQVLPHATEERLIAGKHI